jgi:hypothetical protein
MIAEMIIWGFFSACGWLTANWIKEQVWPEPPAQEQVQEQNKDTKVNTTKQ